MKRKRIGVGVIAALLMSSAAATTQLGAADDDRNQDDRVQHVLPLSIDGMHAVDFENCASAGEEAESPPAET